jgi:Glycosyl transferase family 11
MTAPAPPLPVIARMSGGLGNQIFQYACARTVADRLGTELLLDLSTYGRQPASETPRTFGLDVFRVRYRTAAPEDLRPFARHFGNRWQQRAARLTSSAQVIAQQGSSYDPRIEQVGPGTYLNGHWQSARYFSSNADRLRADLVPVRSFDAEDEAFAARMSASTSVSVHVRRGDYVTNSSTQAHHPTCGTAYYGRAADHLLRAHPDAHFFVFSDDMDWARSHLQFAAPVEFVHRPNSSAHVDMLLMARCRHHIIANSSFSWWGAWLAADRAGSVIAPKEWYRDPAIDTSDLLPPSWIRL